MSNAVAFSPPEDMITSPNMAKYLNLGSRIILRVRQMIHGKRAQGSKSAEVREMYGKTYGDNWYATPAMKHDVVGSPSNFASQRAPRPATTSSVPSHSR